MSDFADFWTNLEGRWLDRHAYYSNVGSCFPTLASRTRRYMIYELITIFTISGTFAFFVVPAALKAIANG